EPREEGADHGGDGGDGAECERVEVHLVVGQPGERVAEQHHRDGGDRVRLEQVRGHPGAVADVVADVVGDHGRVARVVFRDAGLDLAHQVGTDVGCLRVDAAAESGEHGDK